MFVYFWLTPSIIIAAFFKPILFTKLLCSSIVFDYQLFITFPNKISVNVEYSTNTLFSL